MQTQPTESESEQENGPEEFDAFAKNYEEALDEGLSLTGESKTYFAEGRILWLKRALDQLGIAPKAVLDFGCGTGGSTPFFYKHLKVERSLGLDPSEASLEVARSEWSAFEATFQRPEERGAAGPGDGSKAGLAFCNGVFHHIVPEERAAALQIVYDELEPGGIFAFWENNPWNPMTRFIMSRVSFDADAILIWPKEARRLLREAGFEVVSTRFLFIFPNALEFLRGLEPFASFLPLGGQYQVLCRKPE